MIAWVGFGLVAFGLGAAAIESGKKESLRSTLIVLASFATVAFGMALVYISTT